MGLITFTTDKFPFEYVPPVFDNYLKKVNIDGFSYGLGLWDTGGGEDYPRLRPLSYPGTDIFLLCYSTMSHSSYSSIQPYWIPEITHHRPNTPFLLVGTQTDLRTDVMVVDKLAERNENPLSLELGESLAKEVGAVKYLECSALTKEGVKDVFEEAIVAALGVKEVFEEASVAAVETRD